MDWNAVRAQFPGLDDRTFLDAACVSLTPSTAEEAVTRFARELTRPSHRNASEHHLWMDGTREEAAGHVAGLLGVERRNVALVESTTHGLNIAAQSIPWREGDEVVMCNLEFLQVAIPFVQLAKTHGIRPVFLEHEAGVVPASAYAAAINERTKAVVLSSDAVVQRLPRRPGGRGRGVPGARRVARRGRRAAGGSGAAADGRRRLPARGRAQVAQRAHGDGVRGAVGPRPRGAAAE